VSKAVNRNQHPLPCRSLFTERWSLCHSISWRHIIGRKIYRHPKPRLQIIAFSSFCEVTISANQSSRRQKYIQWFVAASFDRFQFLRTKFVYCKLACYWCTHGYWNKSTK